MLGRVGSFVGLPLAKKAPAKLELYLHNPGSLTGPGQAYLATAAKNSLDFTGSGFIVLWPGCQLAGQTSSG